VKLHRVRIRRQEDRIRLIEQQVCESLYGEDFAELRYIVSPHRALAGVPARDDEAQATAVWEWVRESVLYVPDPWPFDLFPTAGAVLDYGMGDCDCHAIVNCALLAILGFPVGLRMIQTDSDLWHVYSTVWLPRAEPTHAVAFDTSWGEAEKMGDEWPRERTKHFDEYVLELRRNP
jgi:transglutaminase-like putative cysteine protease